MKFLFTLVPLVALTLGHPSRPHVHHEPVLVPYVVNPGGIGGIYKGPDSATVVKGPDGSVIKSKQIGGAVEIEDVPPVVVPVAKALPVLHDDVGPFIVHSDGHIGPAVVRTGLGHGGVIHSGGASAGSIHAGPVSAGSIHAGPVLGPAVVHTHGHGLSHAGLIHTEGASAGSIHAGPVTAGSIHAVVKPAVVHTHGHGLGHAGLIHSNGALAGSIHAGPVSAGSIHAGPVSSGSIHTGPVVAPAVVHTHTHSHAGLIHSDGVSAGSIHAGPVSAGSIHVGPSSAGSISVGPSSTGSIHTDVVVPPLIHKSPVILTQDPIIVPDVIVAKDPKIVEEHVIVGHKVISVPKKIEEDTDLIGPSGTISTRGGDAVISGPASVTIKGGGVVTDVDKQPDLHVKTVEVKPVVAPVVTPVVTKVVPAVHPVVEGAGTIITHARPILPIQPVYAAKAPVLGPLHPSVHVHPIGPIAPLRSVVKSAPTIVDPLPLSSLNYGLGGLDVLPAYAPAYVKPHFRY